MSAYSIYFSPTGGTAKVMDIVADVWKADAQIDLSVLEDDYENYQFNQEDICLFGVPSYGGRVPDAALARIRKMKAGNASAVMVVAYGNRAYDDTLLELKNELCECGYRVKAAIAAVTEHSIMRQFASGRPDQQDVKELREYARKIQDSMAKPGDGELKVPGKMPYREYNGVPFKPKARSKCTSCGKCAAECPVGAIPKDAPSTVDDKKCISCMRCVAICPYGARTLGKVMLLAASQKMKKACSGHKENELFLP